MSSAESPAILSRPGHAIIFWWIVFLGPALVAVATGVGGGLFGTEAALYAFFLALFAYAGGVGTILSARMSLAYFFGVLLAAFLLRAALSVALALTHRVAMNESEPTTTTSTIAS